MKKTETGNPLLVPRSGPIFEDLAHTVTSQGDTCWDMLGYIVTRDARHSYVEALDEEHVQIFKGRIQDRIQSQPE